MISMITTMRRFTVFLEEEQLAKLEAISENSSVRLPLSNQIRAAIDEYCKTNSRRTTGWEQRLKKMRQNRGKDMTLL
jgi:hypothetical protein